MALSDKAVSEFKEIFKKEYDKDLTDAEAREYGEQLVGFYKVLADAAFEQWKKDQKLKEFPKGYKLDENAGQYNCVICYATIKGNEVWWDKHGPKCELCQKAIWKRLIPAYALKDKRDSWYEMYQLKDKFGIHTQTARKMVREGKLKARIVPDEKGSPHHYLFLKKENPKLVAYEENHKYLNEKCKCSDNNCGACLATVCLQKDCSVHPLDKKKEPRMNLMEKLRKEAQGSLERSQNESLDEHIRKYNKESHEEKLKYIVLMEESLKP